MEIITVDPFDETALERWHRAWDAGLRLNRTNPPIWRLPEVRVWTRDRDPDRAADHEIHAAVDDDGRVLGGVWIEFPLHDNRNLVEFELGVPGGNRRRGVGTALLNRVRERATALGRTSLVTTIAQPVGEPSVPGRGFAAAHGFTWRNTDERKTLDLPVDPDTLAGLAADAAAHTTGYRLTGWVDACPDEYAEQYAHLKSLLMTDAPTGDLEYEPEVWTVARLRAEEQVNAAQDRNVLTTVAIAPDGSLAGHTQLAVPRHEHGRVFQWDTLVLTAHRGHRLGLALKAANLQRLRADFGDKTSIDTWNAEQNKPMNDVNDRLGFRTLEGLEGWQRGVA